MFHVKLRKMSSSLFDWDFGVAIAPTLAKKKEGSLYMIQLQHSTLRSEKASSNAKSSCSTLLLTLKIAKNQFVPELLCHLRLPAPGGTVRRPPGLGHGSGGGSRIQGGKPPHAERHRSSLRRAGALGERGLTALSKSPAFAVSVLTPARPPWARNVRAPRRCGGRTPLAAAPRVPRLQPPLAASLLGCGDGGAGYGAGGPDSGAGGGSCEYGGG